nr:MAG TPA: hypothetical protein [Caudoviricetes sp.]
MRCFCCPFGRFSISIISISKNKCDCYHCSYSCKSNHNLCIK